MMQGIGEFAGGVFVWLVVVWALIRALRGRPGLTGGLIQAGLWLVSLAIAALLPSSQNGMAFAPAGAGFLVPGVLATWQVSTSMSALQGAKQGAIAGLGAGVLNALLAPALLFVASLLLVLINPAATHDDAEGCHGSSFWLWLPASSRFRSSCWGAPLPGRSLLPAKVPARPLSERQAIAMRSL